MAGSRPMTPDPRAVDDLRRARAAVLARIDAACLRVGRDPGSVTLLAVTKTVDPGRMAAAAAAGLRTFGENRVQEATAKRAALTGVDATWHLIGPLQSNKARKAVDAFDVIETIDSLDLAGRIDRLVVDDPTRGGSAYPVLLQVNVDADPAKAGFGPGDVEPALEALAGMHAVRVDGLMTVGRLVATADEARATFVGLRSLSERLRSRGATLGAALSMGMSDDYEVAVEEGATIVRVGRALFGERPHGHNDATPPHRRAAGPDAP
jgi:PLP dependent protein